MGYESDRQWSDRFIPAMKQIIGPHLLEPAPNEWDIGQATDLVVLQARNVCIAARVRRHGYADRYPYEFTVRSERDSGAATELRKVTDGWGDWMFYGHSGADGRGFDRWWLVDLRAFRAALIRDRNAVRCTAKSNNDGTHFVAFDLRSFPPRPSILVASSHPLKSLEREAA
jgi:hypothetical protein